LTASCVAVVVVVVAAAGGDSVIRSSACQAADDGLNGDGVIQRWEAVIW
jgi:hypothetical protein